MVETPRRLYKNTVVFLKNLRGVFGKTTRCYPPIGIYQLPRLVCTKRLIYYIPIWELCLYFGGNVSGRREFAAGMQNSNIRKCLYTMGSFCIFVRVFMP
ncbi:hypothetical protein EZS27_011444 [termite gut metagenome]|uniref:Uncharacterized protein n=1 Tax=termite gut metagenome TaxID=433724 RepID=A0A5J4S4Q2_9ZZZZ